MNFWILLIDVWAILVSIASLVLSIQTSRMSRRAMQIMEEEES